MFSVWLLQVAHTETHNAFALWRAKAKKRSEKLVAIKVDRVRKLDFPLSSPTDLLHVFQQTTSNNMAHSKIIWKLCIYYSQEKPERLLKKKGLEKSLISFLASFLPPVCLPYTFDSTLCIGRMTNGPATALKESVYWSCQPEFLHCAHRHGYLLHTYVPPKSQIILSEYSQ